MPPNARQKRAKNVGASSRVRLNRRLIAGGSVERRMGQG
jgi:hypothetical protein